MIRTGMGIGRVELVDARTVGAVNAYKATGYAVAPTLFLEFSGLEASVENDVEVVRLTSAADGCSSFDVEADEEAREKLWEARHDAALAIRDLYPGMGLMTTDVCIPISDLPGALRHARDTVESHGLDGVDPGDEADQERAEALNTEIVDYALQRGGTCTGEHGIGLGKTGHLQREHGDSLPLMREIKRLQTPTAS